MSPRHFYLSSAIVNYCGSSAQSKTAPISTMSAWFAGGACVIIEGFVWPMPSTPQDLLTSCCPHAAWLARMWGKWRKLGALMGKEIVAASGSIFFYLLSFFFKGVCFVLGENLCTNSCALNACRRQCATASLDEGSLKHKENINRKVRKSLWMACVCSQQRPQ